MTKRLVNLTVNEVSLVKTGANAKRIYLTKSHQGTDQMNVEEIEKAAADAKVALEKAEAEKAEVVAKLAALEAAQVESLAKAATEKAALEKATADAVAKAAEFEKALAVEKEAKEVSEAIQKASVDYKHLPEKPEDLGPLLRSVRKSDAAVADRLESLLKKLDALSKSALDPKGATLAEDKSETALDEINKRAKALVDSGKAATVAKAFDAVLRADTELYTRYTIEQRKPR
jgi:hypothetical protein